MQILDLKHVVASEQNSGVASLGDARPQTDQLCSGFYERTLFISSKEEDVRPSILKINNFIYFKAFYFYISDSFKLNSLSSKK